MSRYFGFVWRHPYLLAALVVVVFLPWLWLAALIPPWALLTSLAMVPLAALALATRRGGAAMGAAVLVGFFVLSSLSVESRTLRPWEDFWSSVTEIPEAFRYCCTRVLTLASAPYSGRMPARAPSRAALVTTLISRNRKPKSIIPMMISIRRGSTRAISISSAPRSCRARRRNDISGAIT